MVKLREIKEAGVLLVFATLRGGKLHRLLN